jgi:hypothetical protein
MVMAPPPACLISTRERKHRFGKLDQQVMLKTGDFNAALGHYRITSLRRVRPQDEVHDDARHRDIEPNGKRPPGHGAMKAELCARGVPQRAEDQRQRDHREADVGDEDEEVDGANPAVTRKQSVAVEEVIGDIADQKERGKASSADHETHVREAIATADIDVTADEAESAERVEDSVRGGKREHPLGRGYLSLEVDEPDEKGCNGDTQGNDGGNGLAGKIRGAVARG